MDDNNWISVKDKLPPDGLDVFIGGPCCDVCFNMGIGFYEDNEWFNNHSGGHTWEVTHWQPLPSPPQANN